MTLCSFTVSCRFFGDMFKPSQNIADSGHGGQTKDLDGDEADGYDEGVSGVI